MKNTIACLTAITLMTQAAIAVNPSYRSGQRIEYGSGSGVFIDVGPRVEIAPGIFARVYETGLRLFYEQSNFPEVSYYVPYIIECEEEGCGAVTIALDFYENETMVGKQVSHTLFMRPGNLYFVEFMADKYRYSEPYKVEGPFVF